MKALFSWSAPQVNKQLLCKDALNFKKYFFSIVEINMQDSLLLKLWSFFLSQTHPERAGLGGNFFKKNIVCQHFNISVLEGASAESRVANF